MGKFKYLVVIFSLLFTQKVLCTQKPSKFKQMFQEIKQAQGRAQETLSRLSSDYEKVETQLLETIKTKRAEFEFNKKEIEKNSKRHTATIIASYKNKLTDYEKSQLKSSLRRINF